MALGDLDVIYENELLIAVNKPHGLLVHRTRMAKDATEFALQQVRNYVGHRVYPAHRLDRKTSGVLMFAKSPSVNQDLQALFRDKEVDKEYLAIVRGYVDETGIIDYSLQSDGKEKEARTDYRLEQQFEINIPSNGFPTSRYSFVTCFPKTGRFHQIRKHFAHILHPIIGDRPHGCNKQNKLWKEHFSMDTMLLHASTIRFEYPTGNRICIQASPSSEFNRALGILQKH